MNRALAFARHAATAVGVLVAVSLLTYLVFYFLPADPAQLACGKPCTPGNLLRAQEFMGLDQSWYEQCWHFLAGLIVGRSFGAGGDQIHCAAPCLGYSFQENQTVLALIGERLPVTLSVTLGAAVLLLASGVGLGLLAAVREGSRLDRFVTNTTAIGLSMPTYLVGLLAIYVFGFQLDMIPVGGYVPFTTDPVDWAWHLVAPWFVLAWTGAGVYVRLTRSNLIDALGQDYIRTARANGLPERRILLHHGLRNGSVPVLTYFGVEVSLLLGGAVITETVFGMPGLGRLMLDGVSQVDLPTVVGMTVFSAFLVVAGNLLVDIVVRVLDPRMVAR
ncbi:ABC transporter permease [Nocardia camponoti]|uniref:Peptide ABC transporter permease n=1 Tax=Nocardia camponoti TaxID=1616106 RepID=A0A917QR60_9NOCA|nr:ABC transporter permease [Nocardia camponoti]GGK65039.1 peptide ABC transporter permease [Nocardia camponoti]